MGSIISWLVRWNGRLTASPVMDSTSQKQNAISLLCDPGVVGNMMKRKAIIATLTGANVPNADTVPNYTSKHLHSIYNSKSTHACRLSSLVLNSSLVDFPMYG